MSDLRDFQEGIKEVFQELGTDKVLFYPLDTSSPRSIYKEDKDKKYLEPIPLIGLPKYSNQSDTLNTGNSLRHPYLDIEVPLLVIQEAELTIPMINQGKIEFLDTTYQVYEVQPNGFFLGDYSSYTIKCKKVVK